MAARTPVPAPVAAPVRHWPGMRSEYTWLPPRAEPSAPTLTGPFQAGVAFSRHRGLVYECGGAAVRADVRAGAAVVTGDVPISWLRVHEATEALEIYPDPRLIELAAAGASRPVSLRPSVGTLDATLLGIGAVLRRAHVAGAGPADVEASTLAHRLAAHLVEQYAGVPPEPVPRRGLLSARVVARVADLVESRLHGELTLDDLAAEAHLSPFHFARGFARSTGLAPHAYVTARRMDRARQLLWTTDRPVAEVAAAVGYGNLSHFRRVFRRLHGVPPSALRR